MSDIYTEFGVNNAVISSGLTPEEHEQEMLSKPVEVRDRDDRIEVVESPEDEGDESTQEIDEPDEGEGTDESTLEEGGDEGDSGFGPVGEPDAELVAHSEQIGEHEEAFDEMVDTAVSRGLAPESVERIREEYENDGLTEKSYKELAEAGYSKSFVDSYLRGQEALVQQYVSGIMEYAGGRKSFDALFSHLQTHSPESAEALEQAMANRDLRTVKALINLAAGSRSKSFGKPAARSVTKRGVPATAAGAPAAEGYTSTSQMIKAMSDPRYAHDAEYRASVERKVAVSNF